MLRVRESLSISHTTFPGTLRVSMTRNLIPDLAFQPGNLVTEHSSTSSLLTTSPTTTALKGAVRVTSTMETESSLIPLAKAIRPTTTTQCWLTETSATT